MPPKEKSLSSVLNALARAFGGPSDLEELRPLEQLILLILCHDSETRKAQAAMGRLETRYVDWNEVRVTGAHEIATHLKTLGGQKRALAKAYQVQDLLATVYNRFNKLNLDFLHSLDPDPELRRKKDRFLTYLQDMLRKVKSDTARAKREAAKKSGKGGTRASTAKTRKKVAKTSKKTAKKKVVKKTTKKATASKKPSATRKKSSKTQARK